MTNQSMEMATIHSEPWQHSHVTPCSVWLVTPPVSVEMAQEQWGSSLPHLALVSVSEIHRALQPLANMRYWISHVLLVCIDYTFPLCSAIEVTCEDIPDPDNGQIVFDTDTTSPFDLETTATYSCDAGFELQNGDTVRTCEGDGTTETGTWSGMAPVCVGEWTELLPLLTVTECYNVLSAEPFRYQ